jgi:hypothetical protein
MTPLKQFLAGLNMGSGAKVLGIIALVAIGWTLKLLIAFT